MPGLSVVGRRIGLLLTVPLSAVLLYAGTLAHPPVWDDHYYVFGQPFLQECRNLREVLDPRHLVQVLPVKNAARPAWLASVLLDSCLYRGSVAGYRLTSLLWHACGALLLAVLAWRLALDPRLALMAGILFAAHPVHTEPVNIIAFRGDLLCLVFTLLGLALYLGARDKKKGDRRRRLACVLALEAAALLSKETAVIFPLLLMLVDAVFPSRASARPSRLYAASAALVLLFLLYRAPRGGYAMEGHRDLFIRLEAILPAGWRQADPDFSSSPREARILSQLPPWGRVYTQPRARVLTMTRVMGESLQRLFWPHPLQGDYSPKVVASWREPGVWFSAASWLAFLACAWALRRRAPLVSFGLFWTVAAFLPVSGLVVLPNLQADRYLYFPSAGFCLAAAGALAALGRGGFKRAGAAAAALFLMAAAGSAAKTVSRNRDYRDDLSFFQATLAVDPSIARVRYNLARVHVARGELEDAERQYREALRLWPEFIEGRLGLGRFLMAQKREAEAIAEFKGVLSHAPRNPWALYHLGLAHWSLGEKKKALVFLEDALSGAPDLWQADLLAGQILLERGLFDRALPHLAKAAWASGEKSDLSAYYRALSAANDRKASVRGF